jgi:hypothetical protein
MRHYPETANQIFTAAESQSTHNFLKSVIYGSDQRKHWPIQGSLSTRIKTENPIPEAVITLEMNAR